MKFLTGFLSILILYACTAYAGTTAETISPTAEVFFTKNITPAGIEACFDRIKGDRIKGTVAFKVHFGEEGNENWLKPALIQTLVEKLKATFIETNVLYGGERGSTDSHIALAKKHGFGFAPIEIVDSEKTLEIKVEGLRHFAKFATGAGIAKYDTIIVYSHFKGHSSAGFGGAVKNIAMGLAGREGKYAMHSLNIPAINQSRCVKCGLCAAACPGGAITITPEIRIDPKKCLGCGKCIGICTSEVYSPLPDSEKQNAFLEKLAEYAYAISRGRNMLYINVLANISPQCDCLSRAKKPFTGDIGVLASTDPIALDQASLDLVDKACHSPDAFKEHSGASGTHMLEYAESIGMGMRKYHLVNLDTEK
ncbi:MAG: DUF362 domain-containing protein [Candidatus Wallbacteria bacterium]|nr:DUF362 domain-containing protein [Candidatus Wallbacteria bacterium]